jgi:xanthine dehydrogenase small subunit
MLRFTLNGEPVQVADASPNTTLLQWLRAEHLTGTKEGCAEGDCGACTVVMLDDRAPGGAIYRAINSCLLLLPMVHGRVVWTVEGIGSTSEPHPVQQAMVDTMGSQCGYCTPGFVMSLFEACYREDMEKPWQLDDQLCGNLCRCTGYRPIREAGNRTAGTAPDDRFKAALKVPPSRPEHLEHSADGELFVAPVSLDEATSALREHPEARLVCGATDVGLDVTKKHVRFPVLVSTEHIAELRGIEDTADSWSIGASTWLTDLEHWAKDALPVLHRMLRYFGARQIKHRASIGGNLCNASPIGDIAPVLLALDATMVIASSSGARRVPIDDFFLGYRQTALQPGELLARISIPKPPAHSLLGAFKVSRRRELDISAVSAGMHIQMSKDGTIAFARLGYGGVAATPARAHKAEKALIGRPWTERTAEQVGAFLDEDFTPMNDHRGSAEYRKTLVRNLLIGFAHESRFGENIPLLPGHTGTVQELEVLS